MARSEAQREADKRYREKTKGRYVQFFINMKREERDSIEEAIAASGMGKIEFIRWAVKQLEQRDKGE